MSDHPTTPPIGREAKIGASPGTLVHLGQRYEDEARLAIFDYDAKHLEEHAIDSVDGFSPYIGRDGTSWLNVTGLHDPELLRALGTALDLHPLTLEDLMNTRTRPKLEEYPGYLFIVLKMILIDDDGELQIEQVSLVLGARFLLTFQEQVGDVFEPVRHRIRKTSSRVREGGNDYLAYALMDTLVDHYFVVLESLGEQIDEVELALVENPNPEIPLRIRELKRTLLRLRRMIWPLRDVLSALGRTDSPLVSTDTRLFIRDVYDHTIQVIDSIEAQRDILSGMHDLYLSVLSMKMNEVMKILTVIATIFMPITFIAGIYGMNFKNMPELEWRWGYGAALGLMATVCVGMIFVFRKRRLL